MSQMSSNAIHFGLFTRNGSGIFVKNFAVVGGAGFIGSHFIDALASTARNISVIDNYCSGTPSRISNHFGKNYFTFHCINAEDTEELTKAFGGVDTVIHLASNPDIARAAVYPRVDFLQGTALTESVLEASRRAGVTEILYASGSGVYASSGLNAIKEDTLLQPISTYGASKLAGESLLSSYSYMFGIKGISFRFANVVGPRQTHGVGYDFVKKLNTDPTSLEVLGNGTQTKSYIYVTDVVQAVLHASNSVSSDYEVFNVSTLDYITVQKIAEFAVKAKGLKPQEVKVMYGQGDRGWKADVPKIFLDSSKLRSLGWQSQFSSSEAIQKSLIAMFSEV
jgi:UDP-glucose 4-epimerase